MTVQIKQAEVGDIDDIVAFHNAEYDDHRKPEHWVWEYQGYCSDLAVFAIMKDGERVIATQGMMPYHIKVRGQRFLFAKGENTLLSPEYRGGPLGLELYAHVESLCQARGMECIWGFTPASKAIRRYGFQTYEDVMHDSRYFLSLRGALASTRNDNTSSARRLTRSLRLVALWATSSIRRRPRISAAGFSLKEHLANDHDLGDLYVRLRTNYPGLIHIDLDQEYLTWRVFDHPIFKYKTYFIYEGELLRAYALVNTHDCAQAYLTDFTFESAGAGAFLLQEILDQMRAAGIRCVSFLGNIRNPTMGSTFRLLRRFGFVHSSTAMHFVLRNLAFNDESSLFDIENWYMNGLWTEGYRR